MNWREVEIAAIYTSKVLTIDTREMHGMVKAWNRGCMGLVTRLTMCKLYILKAVKFLYVHVKTCICTCTCTCAYSVHVLMRDEKEGRKKYARSNKQQGKATQHTQAHFSQKFKFQKACDCHAPSLLIKFSKPDQPLLHLQLSIYM